MKKQLLLILILGFIIACVGVSACRAALPAEGQPEGTENAGNSFLMPDAEVPSDPEERCPDYSGMLVISEIMPRNRATCVNGHLDDWIELRNLSDQEIPLDNWCLTCDGTADLSGTVIRPGEYLVVFSSENFSVKDASVISLSDPEGRPIAAAEIPEAKNDVSYSLNSSGEYLPELYPTPGFENSRQGYCDYQETLDPESDLIISEVSVYNTSKDFGPPYGYCDWVEIENISDHSLDLSGYCLTDKASQLDRYCLPQRELKPGEYLTILCAGAENAGGRRADAAAAPFKLDSENEYLILSRNGKAEDSIPLRDIPLGCSFGRMSGEAGFFYFEKPGCGKENAGGFRYVSESPSSSLPGGQYTADEPLTVELSGQGTIFYTLDSSEPGFDSPVYSGPIEIERTTVLRAFSCENGQLRSRSVTYNYLLNTEHTLPVVCICTSSAKEMSRIYSLGDKTVELPGNISYYEGEKSFSENCGVSMNGATSLSLVKKSMIVRFRGAYGCSMLKYPLFDEGADEFNALVLRVGQDYYNGVIRNELCQAMARQFSEDLLTQRGKWCAVYVNGVYYGVHALKDNDNAYLYANRYGVSKESVTIECGNVPASSPLYPALSYILKNNMSDEAHYRKACEMVDMNSFADWIIAVGYSGHPDVINGNYKYAVSTEGDGKIRLIYYDLDTSLQRPEYPFINIFSPAYETQMFWLCNSLFRSSEFRALVLRRTSDALHGAFSDENAVAIIENMAAEIDSEMMLDAPRWRILSYAGWKGNINRLKLLMSDYHSYVVNNLRVFMRLTDEEIRTYFGDL